MTTDYTAPDTKKVLVEYPDKTSRETTVGELKQQFSGESQEWFDDFFRRLTTADLEAFGKFARYSIILD